MCFGLNCMCSRASIAVKGSPASKATIFQRNCNRMLPHVVLIQQPAINFRVFLGACNETLGYSPANVVDQSALDRSDSERFLSCLAALRDPKAPAGLLPSLLTHVSFSVMVIADERDMIDIFEAASGMPMVVADTLARGALLAVITGTLGQWRDAVKSGASQTAEHNVRACFCKIMALFQQVGLGSVWAEYNTKPLRDSTFYLEDKRR